MNSTRSWRRFYLTSAVIALVVTTAPFVIAHIRTPEGMRFMGFLLLPMNIGGYFAWMIQAEQGQFFFQNLFAVAPTSFFTVNIFWYALGTMARLTGFTFQTVFELSRIGMGALMCIAFARIVHSLTDDARERAIAFVLILFGTGFGWLYFEFPTRWQGTEFVATAPVDIRLAAAFPFLAMLTYPHVLASFACIALALHWQYHAFLEERRRPAVYAGVVTALVGAFHGFHIVTLTMIPFAFVIVQGITKRNRWWLRAKFLAPSALAAALVITWTLYEELHWPDFVRESFRGQPSPLPMAYLLGFGPLLLLAAPSFVHIIRRWRESSSGRRFIVVWLIAGAPLLYSAPLIPFERRLVQGLIIPLALLAAGTLVAAYDRMADRTRLARVAVAGVLTLSTALLVLPTDALIVHHLLDSVREHRFPHYIAVHELRAFTAIRSHPEWGESVLATFETNQVIPWLTGGRRVYVGHVNLSPDFHTRREYARRFFSAPGGNAARAHFLDAAGIDLVYYGPREQALGRWDPAEATFLHKLYDFGEVQIYKVGAVDG